jgi:hypothetical protein
LTPSNSKKSQKVGLQSLQIPKTALPTASNSLRGTTGAEIGPGFGLFPFPLEDVELEVLGLNWEESFDAKLVAESVEII